MSIIFLTRNQMIGKESMEILHVYYESVLYCGELLLSNVLGAKITQIY